MVVSYHLPLAKCVSSKKPILELVIELNYFVSMVPRAYESSARNDSISILYICSRCMS